MPDATLELGDEQATVRLGRALGRMLRPGDAVLLEGPLGAGKTTLARALLRAACMDPGLEVPSPTYTLAQEYRSPMGLITHFDLWRLDGPGALAEVGWLEARDGVVIVEWPDRLGHERPEGALHVALSAPDGERREARLSGWPLERTRELADAPIR